MGKLKPIALGNVLSRLPVGKAAEKQCIVCGCTELIPKSFELICFDLKNYNEKRIEVILNVCKECNVPQMNDRELRSLQAKVRPFHIVTMENYKQAHFILRMCQDEKATKIFLMAQQKNNTSVQTIPRSKDVAFVDVLSEPRKHQLSGKHRQRKSDSVDLKKTNTTKIPQQIDARGKSLFIYKYKCHCPSCLHKLGYDTIVTCSAVVETIHGADVKMEVQYCTDCHKFMIDWASFRRYEHLFGPILTERRYSAEFPINNAEYCADTILSRCGYNAQENTPAAYRQAILRYILAHGLASKHELKELLSYFIATRGERCYMAVDKWTEDLDYLNQYNIDHQPVVYGLTIKGEQR